MEKKFIICDPEKCVGCQICELACSAIKEKSFNPHYSRIHSVRLKSITEPIADIAIACQLCDDPVCVKVCAPKALSIDEKTGIIKVDEGYSGCNECGWCGVACEFGALILHPIKRVVAICDLCINEEEPACVKACPKDALSLSTISEVMEKVKSDFAKDVLSDFSYSRKNSISLYERIGRVGVKLTSKA